MAQKLLLADDSVTIQRVIELTFADEDIDVIAVGDGQQAVMRIEEDRPDIVLADVGMPERDGYEVAAFVKRTPHLAHIPFLLLTGAFEPVDEDRARAAGCDGVLVKPFEPQMVINRVRDLLAAERPDPSRPVVSSMPVDSGAVLRTDESPTVGTEPADRPLESGAEPLADYFDRLDAAFAGLSPPASDVSSDAWPFGAETPPASPSPQVEPQEDSLPLQVDEREDVGPTEAAEAFEGLVDWGQPAGQEVATDTAVHAPRDEPAVAEDSGAGPADGPETDSDFDRTAQAPAPEREPGAPTVPTDAGVLPSLSEAFEALLAAEQRPSPRQTLEGLPDETLDLVVQRVVERLTGDAVRDVVVDVAERLVRDEIARIKDAAR